MNDNGKIYHKVPEMSQYLDVNYKNPHFKEEKEFWQKRTCGIVSLMMVAKFYKPELPNVSDKLIELGIAKGYYQPGVGWKHEGLIRLANCFGLKGEKFDFSENPEEGIEKLSEEVQKRPIIASIYKDFIPNNGGHLVVMVGRKTCGRDKKFFLMNDPDAKSRSEIFKVVPFEEFRQGWKRRFIKIIQPPIPLYFQFRLPF